MNNFISGGGTTTTTRHFAAWEQTTHFPRGHHTHPLLAASASLNSSSPLIRPIPNRLASPPRSPLTSEAKPSLTSSPQGLNLIKLGKILQFTPKQKKNNKLLKTNLILLMEFSDFLSRVPNNNKILDL